MTWNSEPCSVNLYTPGRVLCMACVKWSPSSPDPPLYSLPEHVGGMIWHVSNCWSSSVGQDAPVGGIAVKRCSLHTVIIITQPFNLFSYGIQTMIVVFTRAGNWTLSWTGLTLWKLKECRRLFCSMSPDIRKSIALIEVSRASLVILIRVVSIWMNEYGALVEWFDSGQCYYLKKNLSRCHFVHHISPGLARNRRRASAVRGGAWISSK